MCRSGSNVRAQGRGEGPDEYVCVIPVRFFLDGVGLSGCRQSSADAVSVHSP